MARLEFGWAADNNMLRGNRILRALPEPARRDVLACASEVALDHHALLYGGGERMARLYFVDRGLVSLVQRMQDGRTIEVGTVGLEGVAGVQAVFGLTQAQLDTVVQMPGRGVSIAAADLQAVAERHPALRELLRGCAHLQLAQIAQTAACNRLHGLEQRCCRWLLTAHDSAAGDEFPLTHDFLATMLGVQRPGVTVAAGNLQENGYIRYARGRVHVLDRGGLEGTACECYASIRDETERLFAGQV